MKTLFSPIHSLSNAFHDSPQVTLRNAIFANTHDWFTSPVQEDADRFMVSVPVPGMSKEDLHVHIEGQLLVVTAKEQGQIVGTDRVSIRRNFKHSFVLPEGVDTNRIHAKCRHGLLTVNIEKTKNKKRPVVIKVSGRENGLRNAKTVSNWWKRIKEKMDPWKFIPHAKVMKTS